MNIKDFQDKIQHASIKRIAISRSPEAGYDFWFIRPCESSQHHDYLAVDTGIPLGFETLDSALNLITKWGYDGAVDLQWSPVRETCS